MLFTATIMFPVFPSEMDKSAESEMMHMREWSLQASGECQRFEEVANVKE
jgi:hypothetical protein